MNVLPLPPAEELHLQDLAYYDIPDVAREQEFNHLMELTALVCSCPVTAIHLLNEEKQWFKVDKDLSSFPVQVNLSFCSQLVEQEVMIVADAKKDERFSSIPLILEETSDLFYAGVCIRNTAGDKLGSLSVMDNFTRADFTPEQENALKTIAKLLGYLLDLKIVGEAGEMIKTLKKGAGFTITELENEREFISYRLQEHFAQTLSATSLYLESALKSPDQKSHYIQKSRDNIGMVMHEIKKLCISMESHAGETDMVEVMKDMVAEWESSNNMYIDFICGTSLQGLKGNSGLALFHIIQHQLKLATYCNAKKAEISILEKKGIILYFSIPDLDFSEPDPQRELLINAIHSRVILLNGEMEFDKNLSHNGVMKITIPEGSLKTQMTESSIYN